MTQIDVAFCCDCTGSMGAYIRSAQANIIAISEQIHTKASNASVRFALVKYRDHPPQDSTFVTEAFPFTEKIAKMKGHVDTMAASGGGDGPEAVSAALDQARRLEWRPNAVKVCILIADAPPHGLGENGDGFPNGCPMGIDPLRCCREMAAMGIVLYAVGVEPILSTQYKFARDFMLAIAKITGGKFLPLGRADVLADVIVQSTLEGANLDALWAKLEQDVAADAAKDGKALNTADLVKEVESRLAAEGGKAHVAQVELENPYLDDNYSFTNCDMMEKCESLSGARAQLNPTANAHVAGKAAAFNWQGQEARCYSSATTAEQQTRMVGHAKKSKGLFGGLFGSS